MEWEGGRSAAGGGAGRGVGGEEGDKKMPKNWLQVKSLCSRCSSTQLYLLRWCGCYEAPSSGSIVSCQPTLESTYCSRRAQVENSPFTILIKISHRVLSDFLGEF